MSTRRRTSSRFLSALACIALAVSGLVGARVSAYGATPNGTRLQPRATSQAPAKTEETCIDDSVGRSSKRLDAAREASLEELATRMEQGEWFSREEARLLRAFRSHGSVTALEADVLISRVLFDVFVTRTIPSPDEQALIDRYTTYLAEDGRKIADLASEAEFAAAIPETEPNDALDRASRGTRHLFRGALGSATDVDHFAVPVDAPGSMVVRFAVDPGWGAAGGKAVVSIVNPYGSVVSSTETASETITLSAAVAGIYSIRVAPSSDATSATELGSYLLFATAACAMDTLDETDPRARRVHFFEQGEECRNGPMRRHEAYEFFTDNPAKIVASLCETGGGFSDYDSFLVVYQAAGGVQLSPFVPNGCENALAANNDFCGESAQVGAAVQAGYFYVMVTGRCGADRGTFLLNVTNDGVSLPCTKVTAPGGPHEEEFTVTISCADEPVTTGSQFAYTVVISNLRHRPTMEVRATDTLPAELALLRVDAPGAVTTITGNSLDVFYPVMEGQTSVSFLITARVDCSVVDGTPISNTVEVRTAPGGGGGGGPHEEMEDHEEVFTDTAVRTAINPAAILTPPSLVPRPADHVVGCSLSAAVDYPMPAVTDNCPGVQVECLPAPGSYFPQGTTMVTCTAIDSGGAESSLAFPVTVLSPFGTCMFDDANGSSWSEVVDPASPIRGFWRCTNSLTGESMCGFAEYVSYRPGRSLMSWDRDNQAWMMEAILNYATGTGTVTLVERATGRRIVLRDRNMRNNPPCQ